MSRKTAEIPRVCERCKTSFVQLWTSNNPRLVRRFCSVDCRNKSRMVPAVERIRRRLGPPTEGGCVIWPGGTNGDGRAIVKVETPRKVMALASRILWEAEHGPIPFGMGVLHTCDNPRCLALPHLFLGTQTDNMRDCVRKGRCGIAKLTPEQVVTMRGRVAAGELTPAEAAKEYAISLTNTKVILSRKTWREV